MDYTCKTRYFLGASPSVNLVLYIMFRIEGIVFTGDKTSHPHCKHAQSDIIIKDVVLRLLTASHSKSPDLFMLTEIVLQSLIRCSF